MQLNKFTCSLIKKYNVKFNQTIWIKERIVWLNHFIIPQKFCRIGIGSKIMDQFIKWLDQNQMICKLLVCNCYGTPNEVLIKFYSRFGFKIDDEKTNNMYMIRFNK